MSDRAAQYNKGSLSLLGTIAMGTGARDISEKMRARARHLAELFRENFRQFKSEVSSTVASVGPAAACRGAS